MSISAVMPLPLLRTNAQILRLPYSICSPDRGYFNTVRVSTLGLNRAFRTQGGVKSIPHPWNKFICTRARFSCTNQINLMYKSDSIICTHIFRQPSPVQSVTQSNLARVRVAITSNKCGENLVRVAITSNECGEHLVACSLLGVVGLESGHCRYFFNQRLELRQLV